MILLLVTWLLYLSDSDLKNMTDSDVYVLLIIVFLNFN